MGTNDDDDDLWQRGHRRPWWYFNVLTLFGALFVLVWLRFLFDLPQGATIFLTVLVLVGWFILGAVFQPMPKVPPLLRPGRALNMSAAAWGERPPGVASSGWRVPLHVRNLHEVVAFTTKDGSEIRELLAYRNSCVRRQSLAEARLPPGASTTPHYHPHTEEIYYVLSGTGTMRLEQHVQEVGPGDAIAIPRGARHQITNSGSELLTFLCCCVPAYEHEDTVLVDDWPDQGSRVAEDAGADPEGPSEAGTPV